MAKNWKENTKQKELIKITGILTSSVQLRGENTTDHYYYAFVRLKGQSIDLPVIFKVKDDQENLIKSNLKKGDQVKLAGHYSNSHKNVRKSFTCSDYQVLDKNSTCHLEQSNKEENIFVKNA